MKKVWFKAKRYGWGWYPSSLEGWVVLVVYICFNVWNFIRIDAGSHSTSDTIRPFIIQGFITTIVLLIICTIKGEKPRWRWGK